MIEIRQLPSILRLTTLADGSVGLNALGLVAGISARKTSVPDTAEDHCTPGLALAGHGEAFNELAFHYFLEVERQRFERSGQRYALLLIDFNVGIGEARLDEDLSAPLFDALTRALRETDVIGWYRERRIAGALLTHLEDASVSDVSTRMAERITRALQDRLPPAVAARVVVRSQPFQENLAS